MKRVTPTALVVLVLCAAHGRGVSAQSSGGGDGRLEVSVGGVWIGQQPLGSATATETTSTLGSLPLFSTSSTLAGAPAVEGRVGWRIARALTAEAEAGYGRPELRIAISNDFEGAGAIIASERIQQFTIGGALVWHLPLRTGRAAPFVTAGAGYLRQLHENATLVQTGRYYQFGGGFTVLLASRPQSALKAMGLRADARAIVHVDGVAFDATARVAPAAGASFFVRF